MAKMMKMTVVLLMVAGLAYAGDWPGFRNADRTGISPETGLLDKWPEDGPKEIWSVDGLGMGYASASIANGMIYTTGLNPETNDGYIFAFDLDGKLLWKKNYGPEWRGSYKGSRTTPVIEDNLLYIMTGYGVAKCFDAKSGQEKWSIDTFDKFKGKNITWGISESILIYKDKIICTPGGDDASVLALNKITGETVWQAKGLGQRSAYCSPLVVNYANKNIVVTMLEKSFVGIDADNGEILWQETNPNLTNARLDTINPVTPVYHNGHFYITSGYGCGGAMFKINDDARGITKIWESKELDVHHGGVVLIDGKIYGSSHSNNRGNWLCLDFMTGEVMYKEKGLGNQGSIIAADGKLYCWEEGKGTLALVKADPSSFDIISSFQITKGDREFWAHPAISNGVMYIRHGDVMMAFDIKKQ